MLAFFLSKIVSLPPLAQFVTSSEYDKQVTKLILLWHYKLNPFQIACSLNL